jgi:hypothetical protein
MTVLFFFLDGPPVANFENCVLLGYYVASSGKFLPTFREGGNLDPAIGTIGCPEMSVRVCDYSPRNNPEDRSFRLFFGGSLQSRRESPVFEGVQVSLACPSNEYH